MVYKTTYIAEYVFLLLIITLSLYSSTMHAYREKFTPGINKLYRPYVRSARIFSEGFYKHTNHRVNSFLRKVGLY